MVLRFTSPTKSGPVLILIVLLFLGGWLRSINIMERSLWQDEVFTVASAAGNTLFEETLELTTDKPFDPASPVPPSNYRARAEAFRDDSTWFRALQRNIQGPIFPWLTRQWFQIRDSVLPSNNSFHPTELRWLSIGFSLFSVLAAYWAGRTWLSKPFGLACAGLVSLSYVSVVMGQTARVYSMLLLLTWLSFGLIALLWHNKLENKATNTKTLPTTLLLGLCHVIGVLSQYLFGLFTAGQITWMLWFAWRHPSERCYWLTQAGIASTMVGVALLLWWPSYQAQMTFLHEVGHGNLSGLWKPLSLVERLWSSLADQVFWDASLLKISATLVIAWGLWSLWKAKPQNEPTPLSQENKPLRALAMMAIISIVMILAGLIGVDVVGETHRILNKRYVLLAGPGILLLFAIALHQIWQRIQAKTSWQQTFKTTSVLILGITFVTHTYSLVSDANTNTKEDYAQAGKIITTYQQPNDVLLVSHSGVHAVAISYYLPQNTSLKMLGVSRKAAHQAVQQNNVEHFITSKLQFSDAKQVWLALTHLPAEDRTPLLTWFKTHATLVRYDKLSDIGLYCFKDIQR